jgi:hypothetical protein
MSHLDKFYKKFNNFSNWGSDIPLDSYRWDSQLNYNTHDNLIIFIEHDLFAKLNFLIFIKINKIFNLINKPYNCFKIYISTIPYDKSLQQSLLKIYLIIGFYRNFIIFL